MARVGLMGMMAVLMAGAGAWGAEPAPAPRLAKHPRFDLTYLPEIDGGLIGIRPVEIARHARGPELNAITSLVPLFLAQVFRDANFDAAPFPDLADLEQCVFKLNFQITAPTSKSQGSFTLGGVTPCVFRTMKPFDWDGLIRKWFPRSVSRKLAGRTYRRLKINMPPELLKGQTPHEFVMALFVADDRTLLCAMEDDVFEVIDRLADGGAPPTPPPGWNQVDHDFFAAVLDMREDSPLSGTIPASHLWGKDLSSLLGSCQTLAVGLDVGQRTTLQMVGTTKNGNEARTAARSLQRLTMAARVKLVGEEDGSMKDFALEMLRGSTVVVDADRFEFRAGARGNAIEMIAALLHGQD